MKMCYVDKETRAIVDLIELPNVCLGKNFPAKSLLITRINVPFRERKKGVGTRLIQEILTDADNEQYHLYLQLFASGEMKTNVLRAWYLKHGFVEIELYFFHREPKNKEMKED